MAVYVEQEGRPATSKWKFFHTYPVFAASGTWGPKLREGDLQVPEGVYQISFLNQQSHFHLALRLNYPNTFDLEMGSRDGRRNLGGDIMIHGSNVSAGCLAIGNPAIEELFALASDSDYRRWKVILAPYDLLKGKPPMELEKASVPHFYPQLLGMIKSELSRLEIGVLTAP